MQQGSKRGHAEGMHGYRPKQGGKARPSASGPPDVGRAHSRKCPAREATCSNCRKKGHYQVVYYAGARNQRRFNPCTTKGTMKMCLNGQTLTRLWIANVLINLRVDTGADVIWSSPTRTCRHWSANLRDDRPIHCKPQDLARRIALPCSLPKVKAELKSTCTQPTNHVNASNRVHPRWCEFYANSGFWQVELILSRTSWLCSSLPLGRYFFTLWHHEHLNWDAPGHGWRTHTRCSVTRWKENTIHAWKLSLPKFTSRDSHSINRSACLANPFPGTTAVDQSGACPDPDKVQTMQEMKAPTEVKDQLTIASSVQTYIPNPYKTFCLKDVLSTSEVQHILP